MTVRFTPFWSGPYCLCLEHVSTPANVMHPGNLTRHAMLERHGLIRLVRTSWRCMEGIRKTGSILTGMDSGHVKSSNSLDMYANHQKIRVYQLDFDKSAVRECLVPGQPASEDWRFHHCVPLTGRERTDAIHDLVTLFPEGILVQQGNDSVRCCISGKYFCQFWLRKIREVADRLDVGNIAFASGPTAGLVRCVQNPLDTSFLFCIQDLPFSWTALPSSSLLRALCCLEEGDRLYVGSVLDCR